MEALKRLGAWLCRRPEKSTARQLQPRTKPLSKSLMLALEPRVMFDGAGFLTGVDAFDHDLKPVETPKTNNDHPQADCASSSLDTFPAPPTPVPVTPPARHEVVFVDGGVTDYQTLVNSIASGVEVHVLDPNRNGLEQMAAVLAGRQGLDAIHLVSHGRPGEVKAGNIWLDAGNVTYNTGLLRTIGGALTESGDLLLYGCDVGKGVTGAAFIDSLAKMTGVDVAASDNLTGSAAKDGDWILEKTSGTIETASVMMDKVEDYSQLLSAPTVARISSPVIRIGGTGADYGDSVVVDQSGYVYTTGRFSGSVDFDPGPGEFILNGSGSNTAFIQKVDSDGNLIWAKGFGVNGNSSGDGIAVDNGGYVYIAGQFGGTVDLDPGTGVVQRTSSAQYDMFVE
ncbi:MAG: DUF4347 domain-containing protein, partial [Magnetococcales bacterium]|nr:DUF4347 domain-containing protein [Magnetococcales bacterium]